MKVKAVFELEMPDELVKACLKNDFDAYNKVFANFAEGINYEIEHEHLDFDTLVRNTCIKYYRFYNDTCDILFES